MVRRLMELAEQPPKPPYHLDLPQRLARPATSPVSRSTSAIACRLRGHTQCASRFGRRPAA